MKITFEINRKQIKVGDYCEGEDLMRQLDPRVLYFKNDPGRQERVEKRIEKYQNFSQEFDENSFAYTFFRLDGNRFPDHFWMGRDFIPSLQYYLITYSAAKQFCLDNYKVP